MLREEEIPIKYLRTSYKFSRHECPKVFHTWGLDLAGLIYPPLNGCIQVFAALSNPLNKSNGNGCSQLHQGAYRSSLQHLAQDHKWQIYISLIPIFEGKPYKTLGNWQTIILSKHGETPTCEGAMPLIR